MSIKTHAQVISQGFVIMVNSNPNYL